MEKETDNRWSIVKVYFVGLHFHCLVRKLALSNPLPLSVRGFGEVPDFRYSTPHPDCVVAFDLGAKAREVQKNSQTTNVVDASKKQQGLVLGAIFNRNVSPRKK